MIDRWFIDDINGALCNCGRAVVTDAHEKGKFLLDFLPDDVVLLEIASTDLLKSRLNMRRRHIMPTIRWCSIPIAQKRT